MQNKIKGTPPPHCPSFLCPSIPPSVCPFLPPSLHFSLLPSLFLSLPPSLLPSLLFPPHHLQLSPSSFPLPPSFLPFLPSLPPFLPLPLLFPTPSLLTKFRAPRRSFFGPSFCSPSSSCVSILLLFGKRANVPATSRVSQKYCLAEESSSVPEGPREGGK